MVVIVLNGYILNGYISTYIIALDLSLYPQTKNIYYFSFYRESLPTPTLITQSKGYNH